MKPLITARITKKKLTRVSNAAAVILPRSYYRGGELLFGVGGAAVNRHKKYLRYRQKRNFGYTLRTRFYLTLFALKYTIIMQFRVLIQAEFNKAVLTKYTRRLGVRCLIKYTER